MSISTAESDGLPVTQQPELSSEDEAEFDAVIAELDADFTGKLPVEAIREAQRRRDDITPRLIDLIRKAADEVRAGNERTRNGHLYALFLLTEFEAKQALPAIIEAVSLPEEGPFELFGDAITEDLHRVLATLAADSPEIVDELIANRDLNEYVRCAAAEAYLCWVRDGRLERDEAVARLQEHLRVAMRNEDAPLVEGLVSELTSYSPKEALEDIQEAFRRGLVDPMMIDMNFVEQSIAKGEAYCHQSLSWCKPSEVTDTVEELESWYSFQDKEEPDPPATTFTRDDDWDDHWDEPAFPSVRDDSTTIRNTIPKVGRNEPCPCGSGKKYKKCCGAG